VVVVPASPTLAAAVDPFDLALLEEDACVGRLENCSVKEVHAEGAAEGCHAAHAVALVNACSDTRGPACHVDFGVAQEQVPWRACIQVEEVPSASFLEHADSTVVHAWDEYDFRVF
jgi:hypothetical protein